jgi:hypothetical protein
VDNLSRVNSLIASFVIVRRRCSCSRIFDSG